jgi:hypothetical protein
VITSATRGSSSLPNFFAVWARLGKLPWVNALTRVSNSGSVGVDVSIGSVIVEGIAIEDGSAVLRVESASCEKAIAEKQSDKNIINCTCQLPSGFIRCRIVFSLLKQIKQLKYIFSI